MTTAAPAKFTGINKQMFELTAAFAEKTEMSAQHREQLMEDAHGYNMITHMADTFYAIWQQDKSASPEEWAQKYLQDHLYVLQAINDYFVRKCTSCGAEMAQGYVYETLQEIEYFDTKACMYKRHSKEDYEESYEDGLAYWTEWGEDE